METDAGDPRGDRAGARLHDPSSQGDADAYRRRIRSGEYRRERAEKSRVISAVFGPEIEAADRVADLGTGTGLMAAALEARHGTPVLGFDLQTSFVERRRRTAAGDALRLPLPDASFDAVLCNHLYEHVPDRPRLFREIGRILRPGGSVYVAAGNRWAVVEPHYRLPLLSWLPRPLADRYLRLTGRGRSYRGIRFSTHGRLTGWMEDAGLEVEDRTELAIDRMLAETRGAPWTGLWAAFRALPGPVRGPLLRALSPQWWLVGHRGEGGEG